MFYYTYQIFDLTSKKFYIGKRNSKVHPSKDLGVKYFSSSKDKDFIKSQKVNPKNFEYRILGVFATEKEALTHEVELHEIYKVDINKRFYNRAKQKTVKFYYSSLGNGDIIQRYSIEGELLEENTIAEYITKGYSATCIYRCVNGKENLHNGNIFKYKDDKYFKWPINFAGSRKGQGKIIEQYDAYTKEFIKEATLDVFLSEGFNCNIFKVCNNKKNHHKGYVFKYKDDDNFKWSEVKIDSTGKIYKKIVQQYSLDKVLIKEGSFSEFEKEGFDKSIVRSVCVGNTKQYKDYYWKYKDDKSFKFKEIKKAIIIQQFDLKGNFIREGDYHLFDSLGFQNNHIYDVCKGKSKTHKGFKFRFK